MTDSQWKRLRPLLPPQKPPTGRPAKEHRNVLRVAGDKAYSSAKVRHYLCRREIGALIPRKANEQREGRFDRQAYRERNVVERLINRLKQHRRVATRYEKRAANYRAMVSLACILL